MLAITRHAAPLLRVLLAEYRFGAIEAVVEVLEIPDDIRRRVARLAHAGERLLELDAEDFDVLAEGGWLPDDVTMQVRAAQFPRTPAGTERGSLESLVPLYELMLEALAARWRRREPSNVVVLLHLISEYLPLLAWESTLGHAGDPARLSEFVHIDGSRWGKRSGCDHTAAHRSGAGRVAGAATGDAETFTVYLDRFHSRVSEALARCAARPAAGRPNVPGTCRQPCSVWTQLSEDARADLGARVQLVRMYAESPVVDLRHHAPVGHFFGVPAPEEIRDAWNRTWRRLIRRWRDGANPLTGVVRGRTKEPLPGLSALVSAVAGRPVRAGSVLRAICASIESEALPELRDKPSAAEVGGP